MTRFWSKLYGKVRADLAASLATGGGATGALFLLDYLELLSTDPGGKAAIAGILGWLGGKLAAVLRYETHPAGPRQEPAPTPPTGA